MVVISFMWCGAAVSGLVCLFTASECARARRTYFA